MCSCAARPRIGPRSSSCRFAAGLGRLSTQGRAGALSWRSASGLRCSGAFATTHTLPEYLKVYGDLITPQNFKYIIECKKGYNEEQVSDLLNPKSTISKMIAQAHRDSKKSSRKFLLFIGQNRKEPMAITNELDLPVKGPSFVGSSGDVQVAMFRLCDLVRLDDCYFFLENP